MATSQHNPKRDRDRDRRARNRDLRQIIILLLQIGVDTFTVFKH